MRYYRLRSGIFILGVMMFAIAVLNMYNQRGLDESSFDYWRLEILKLGAFLCSGLFFVIMLHYQNLEKIEDLHEKIEGPKE